MNDRYILEFIVGGIFVIIYAFSRFSNTRVDTHLPTSTRYTVALAGYIGVTIFIYFFLSMAITAGITIPFLGINKAVEDLRKLFLSTNQVFSAQLLVALLMTEALPRIKKFAYADRQLRILFQRLASLSSIAQNLSSKFQKEELMLQDGQRQDILKAFQEWGFDQKDIETEISNKPQHIWTRISLLKISLNKWERLQEYQSFLNSHDKEIGSLKSEFENLSVKAKYCFELSDVADSNAEMKHALRDCTKHYMMQLRRHLQKLADFMSRGLLSVKKGHARVSAINEMGFASGLKRGLSIDQLTLMFVIIFSILLIGFGFSHWAANHNGQSPGLSAERFLRAIMIASIYSIGIVCAIIATWRSEKKSKDQHAWFTYFFMSAVAVAAGSLVSIAVNTIMNKWNLDVGVKVFMDQKWPWQLLIFTTTFLVSYLLNRKVNPPGTDVKTRILEGGIMCAALGVGMLIAGSIMQLPHERFLKAIFIVPAIGFSIGFFIPSWYRSAPRHDKEHLNNMIEYAGMASS